MDNITKNIIHSLENTYKSQRTIATEVGVSKHKVAEVIKSHNIQRPEGYEEYLQKVNGGKTWATNRNQTINQELPLVKPTKQEVYVSKKQVTFQTKQDLFKQFIGEQSYAFQPKQFKQSKNGTRAILNIGDLHVPYVDKTKLHQIVNDFIFRNSHIGQHTLVINGDFLDGYALNSYGRDDRVETFKDEIQEGRIILNWLSSVFDEIVLVDDNHVVSRFKRLLEGKIDPQLQFLVQDPYDILIAGFGNVRRATKQYKNGEYIGWFTQIGDAIFCHAEVHSSAPLKAVHEAYNWFGNWKNDLGLPDFTVVVQNHVHKLGSYAVPGKDVKLFEGGCLVTARGVKYAYKGECKYKPPVHGYVEIIQHNGVTDHNASREYRI